MTTKNYYVYNRLLGAYTFVYILDKYYKRGSLMAYQPLNLGSNTQSREALDTSLKKINQMLGELYTIPLEFGDNIQLNLDFNSLTNVPSVLLNITDENFYNWNEAYEWGDHSAQGYLKPGDIAIPQRTTISATTGDLAPLDTEEINLNGYRGYVLYKIETSAAAWVRIYADSNSRFNDLARLQEDDPAANSGVIAEVITSGNESVLIAPGVYGFNNELIPLEIIPVSVRNLSQSNTPITITLTVLKTES